MRSYIWCFIISLTGSAACVPTHGPAASPPAVNSALQAITLPGVGPQGVFLDFIAYDALHHRVWVPAGATGRVDVIDVGSGRVSVVGGFPTTTVQYRGKKHVVGPSSVAIGDGWVYVGNRGDSSVCAISEDTLVKAACVKLDSMPDAVGYVQSTNQVWVTTPRAKAIVVLDASVPSKLAIKATIALEGAPECYAIDEARGIFYTNLEDKDRTLAIDLKSRHVSQTWQPACGDDGPRGLALDPVGDFLMVACHASVKVLDAGHGGAVVSSLNTGAGMDSINYVPARHELFAAAGVAAHLVVARLTTDGHLSIERTVPTAPRARNAVGTDTGQAFLTDSRQGKILIVAPH